MSVREEIQQTVRAIRRTQPPEATLLHAVAGLLDHIALSTPDTVIESQAGATVRWALAVARAYRSPGTSLPRRCSCAAHQGFNPQCVEHGLAVAR